jgi:pilus assembly protein Flp/PilA
MRLLAQHVVQFLKGEDGPTAVEYAVMIALIIAVCLGAIHTLGRDTSSDFKHVSSKVSTT